jgi:hypothetical protein
MKTESSFINLLPGLTLVHRLAYNGDIAAAQRVALKMGPAAALLVGYVSL